MITREALTAQVTAALDAWSLAYEFDYDQHGCQLTVAYDGYDVHVDHISVPPGRGYGGAIMKAVTAWADRNGEALWLHKSVEYGTDLAKLTAFCERHGFEPVNRGGDMLRPPAAAHA